MLKAVEWFLCFKKNEVTMDIWSYGFTDTSEGTGTIVRVTLIA